MLSERDNDTLTRVGPGTPMGTLLRRYWHPVAVLDEMRNRLKRIASHPEDAAAAMRLNLNCMT